MMKILTVDDDAFYEQLYKDIFTGVGIKTAHAFSATEGIEKAEEFKPDLIILDVMMPEKNGMMDGYAMLENLRANKDTVDTPIIMISALDESGDIDRAMSLGATTYIPKQKLSPDVLIVSVKELLNIK